MKTINETFLPIIKPTDKRAGDKDIPNAKIDLKGAIATEKTSEITWNPDCSNYNNAPNREAFNISFKSIFAVSELFFRAFSPTWRTFAVAWPSG